MKNLYITACLLLAAFSMAFAQPRWEMGVFAGLANYQGDLVKETVPLFKEGNPALGVTGRYVYDYSWTIRGNLVFGKISGDDNNYRNDDFRKNRNISFENPIFELSGCVEWEPLGEWRYLSGVGFKKMISPYIMTGFGLAFTNPKVDYPDETGGSAEFMKKIEEDKNAKYFKARPAIPIAIGVKLDLDDLWFLSLEFGMRYPFTDYLDGVSATGNPDKKDWYQFSGIQVIRRLKSTIRRH